MVIRGPIPVAPVITMMRTYSPVIPFAYIHSRQPREPSFKHQKQNAWLPIRETCLGSNGLSPRVLVPQNVPFAILACWCSGNDPGCRDSPHRKPQGILYRGHSNSFPAYRTKKTGGLGRDRWVPGSQAARSPSASPWRGGAGLRSVWPP